jgi:hypothetical protein
VRSLAFSSGCGTLNGLLKLPALKMDIEC